MRERTHETDKNTQQLRPIKRVFHLKIINKKTSCDYGFMTIMMRKTAIKFRRIEKNNKARYFFQLSR